VSTSYLLVGILGMAVITVITRALFLMPRRELPLPPWALQGLRYAPLAALIAVIAPEILLTDGQLVATWQDARIYAVIAGTAWFAWRRSILGTIVAGTAVMLALRIGLGW
jgi:branched-subunit amino acid transport protein